MSTTRLQNNSETEDYSDFARTILILSNYDWIKTEASAIGIDIIPIKGIDLLQTIYTKTLDRYLNDIDILCRSDEECIKLVNRLCQEEYRVEFPFSTRPEALASKRKISLLSCSTTKVNVDVHTAFVTKKFFSKTIGSFNLDALNRCKGGRMNDYDRWIFLAQHTAFHKFSDRKWTKDLRILIDEFSNEQVEKLMNTAVSYGFKRVMLAALYHIYKDEPPLLKEKYSYLTTSAADKRFMNFICKYDRPFSHNIIDKLISAYWEFVFIDDKKERQKSLFSLLFPNKGSLTNIYRIKNPKSIFFFYTLNFIIVCITSSLFGLLYAVACVLNARGIRIKQ